MNERILIVEDEPDINHLLKHHLSNEGYDVTQAFNGKEAWQVFNASPFDLVILDVMMPVIDGFTLLEMIREISEIPILFLTARTEETDKITGLELGADDYVVKPFSPLEIISRVKALLRRYLQYANKQKNNFYTNGNISFDSDHYRVFKNGAEIYLNPKEFKIFSLMIQNIGRIYTKEQLYENVWGETYYGDANTIMVHISHLRERIEDDPRNPQYIKTIKGLGYRMEKVK